MGNTVAFGDVRIKHLKQILLEISSEDLSAFTAEKAVDAVLFLPEMIENMRDPVLE